MAFVNPPSWTPPVSQSKFFVPQNWGQSAAAATFTGEEEGDWWSGVWQYGARVALAAALVVATGQTAVAQTVANGWQDDPAGNLHQPVNEDYWQNQVLPVPLSFYQQLPLTDVEQVPVGGLFGRMEEDYWPQQLLPPPVPLTFGKLYLPDPDEIPAARLHGQFDEDFWPQQLLPAPVPFTLGSLYLPDADSTPAGGLHGQPDEDFWQNPVLPVPLSFLALQQWGFDDQTPALSAAFTPDEDYWSLFGNPGLVSSSSLGIPIWMLDGDATVIPAPPAGSSQDDRISYDKYGTGNYMSGDISIGRDQ
jgi:hypothetical protein